MNQMKLLVDKLKDTPKKLFFVVPDAASFTKEQDFTTTDLTKAVNIPEELQSLEQFVIEVELSKK